MKYSLDINEKGKMVIGRKIIKKNSGFVSEFNMALSVYCVGVWIDQKRDWRRVAAVTLPTQLEARSLRLVVQGCTWLLFKLTFSHFKMICSSGSDPSDGDDDQTHKHLHSSSGQSYQGGYPIWISLKPFEKRSMKIDKWPQITITVRGLTSGTGWMMTRLYTSAQYKIIMALRWPMIFNTHHYGKRLNEGVTTAADHVSWAYSHRALRRPGQKTIHIWLRIYVRSWFLARMNSFRLQQSRSFSHFGELNLIVTYEISSQSFCLIFLRAPILRAPFAYMFIQACTTTYTRI